MLIVAGCVIVISAIAIGSQPAHDGVDGGTGAVNLIRHLIVATLIAVVLVTIAFVIYIFWPREDDHEPLPIELPKRMPWYKQLLAICIPLAVGLSVAWLIANARKNGNLTLLTALGLGQPAPPTPTSTAPAVPARPLGDYWLSMAGLALLVIAALAVITMLARRRPRAVDSGRRRRAPTHH